MNRRPDTFTGEPGKTGVRFYKTDVHFKKTDARFPKTGVHFLMGCCKPMYRKKPAFYSTKKSSDLNPL